jgi:3-hydroxybutyrate dehydrogenase
MFNGLMDGAVIQDERTSLEEKYNIKTAYSNQDIGTAAGCEKLINGAIQTLGRLDILVNNAGIQHVSAVEDFPLDKWQAILNVNLSSAFYTSHYALPHFYAQKFGRIINIASAHGLVGSIGKAAYVAAKHGIVGLSKVIGLEAAGKGVTCNAICPGWVLTPLVAKQIQDRAAAGGITFDEAKNNLLMEKQPSGEFASPEEIGAMVAFLASSAANQITGTSLAIDGGWTAR